VSQKEGGREILGGGTMRRTHLKRGGLTSEVNRRKNRLFCRIGGKKKGGFTKTLTGIRGTNYSAFKGGGHRYGRKGKEREGHFCATTRRDAKKRIWSNSETPYERRSARKGETRVYKQAKTWGGKVKGPLPSGGGKASLCQRIREKGVGRRRRGKIVFENDAKKQLYGRGGTADTIQHLKKRSIQ